MNGSGKKGIPEPARGFVIKRWLGYSPFFIFIAFVGVSHYLHWEPGVKIGLNFRQFFVEMLMILPLVFLLIGLIDVWVPREAIRKRVGAGSGMKGIFWVALLAMLQAGPLYAAFPVAYLLWEKGCSTRNIFIYLSCFSAMKFPMLTFEIGFMGLRFSLTRLIFTLPVFIGIGFLLDRLMGEDYTLPDPGAGAGPVPATDGG